MRTVTGSGRHPLIASPFSDHPRVSLEEKTGFKSLYHCPIMCSIRSLYLGKYDDYASTIKTA